MKYSSDKDMNEAVAALVARGWTFKRGSKHDKVLSPGGTGAVVFSRTPSDRRAVANFSCQAQRIEAAEGVAR